MTEPPTVDDVLRYMKTTTTDPDELDEIQQALDAAMTAQEHETPGVSVVGYTPDLFRAAVRRTVRMLASRAVPLGVIADLGEFGVARLAQLDSEIEQLERPHRPIVVA